MSKNLPKPHTLVTSTSNRPYLVEQCVNADGEARPLPSEFPSFRGR